MTPLRQCAKVHSMLLIRAAWRTCILRALRDAYPRRPEGLETLSWIDIRIARETRVFSLSASVPTLAVLSTPSADASPPSWSLSP